MRCSSLVVLGLMLLTAGTASASTEINGLFDARSGAMGGTGAAFLDSAGAIPTNPALLDQIKNLALTLDAFYIRSQPEAPYTVYHLDSAGNSYANYETIRSSAASAVLPFLGGAYRVHDRIVIGLAVYPVIGQGTSAKYRPAPDQFPQLVATNEAAMGLVEAGLPVSVRLLDNLSLALMWRVTYMTQSINAPVPTGKPPAGVLISPADNTSINANIKVTGLNFAGLQAGLLYKPLQNLSFGFTYRSKVIVDGSGTTTTKLGGQAIVLDTMQGYTNPHMFRLGVAWTLANDALLLAADFKYLMYADAFKVSKSVMIMNGKQMVNYKTLNWKDAYTVQLGAEYKLAEMWRIRAGYILATSATRPEYAISQAAPPGISHLFGGGFGVKIFDSLNLDLAAAYVVLASRVNVATPDNAGIGYYASHGVEISESITYHN